MATPRKHWFYVADALGREPLTNDQLACSVRLMAHMNSRRSRDKLDPEAACRCVLRAADLFAITGKGQLRAARALLEQVAARFEIRVDFGDASGRPRADLAATSGRGLGDLGGMLESQSPRARGDLTAIEWPKLAIYQGWAPETRADDTRQRARELPSPDSGAPTPTPEEQESPPVAAEAPSRAELLSRGPRRPPPEAPPEAVGFAADFLDGLQAVHEGFKVPSAAALRGWQNDARLLLQERPLAEAQALAQWLFEDPGGDAAFWRPNVLCVRTFRKQYDRLAAVRKRSEVSHARPSPLETATRNILRDIQGGRY